MQKHKPSNRRIGNAKLNQETIDHMFMWWIIFDGNNQLVADKITEFRGKKTSRKTVRAIAMKNNFEAKAPLLKAEVDKFRQQFHNIGEKPVTAQEVHFTEVGLDLLTIDITLIKQAKKFIQGDKRSNTPFKNVAEVITALKYVADTISEFTGKTDKEIRKNALQDAGNDISKRLVGNVVDLLEELPKEQHDRIVARYRQRAIDGEIKLDSS